MQSLINGDHPLSATLGFLNRDDEMTVKEIEVFYEVYDLCEKKMKAANRLRLPYSVAEFLLKERERRDRKDEEYEQWLEEEEEISYIMAQLD